jgi:hypothetical protein
MRDSVDYMELLPLVLKYAIFGPQLELGVFWDFQQGTLNRIPF